MTRLFSPLRLAALLTLLAVTAACSHAAKRLIGNPENPYPLPNPPKVGDIVHLPTGVLVTPEQMYAIAGDARIVYVGETHDNPGSHRIELEVLKAMEARHPGKQALGMEMFTPSQQGVLDRWVSGKIDEKTFLKESKWYDRWKMDFGYYRDILLLARDRHIPVIGLNAEKSQVKQVMGKEKGEHKLPELDLNDPYQRALTASVFGGHVHGDMQLDAFVRAQTLWDETMAETAANYLQSEAGKDRHLVVIAGGDHVSYGFGIPRRVFRRFPASYVIIGGHELNVAEDKKDRLMEVVDIPIFPMVAYDFLAYIGYEDLPQTGVRLGVVMEPAPAGKGLVVKEIMPKSNAERAGIRKGDILVGFDNEKLAENLDLIYALREKHAGDHATIRLEREGKPVTVDVVLQAEEKHPQTHGTK